MKNIVGQAVRKDNFWNREDILEDLKAAIDNGAHVLMTAPRRVGKTSIMFKFLDTAKTDYLVLYVITESADTSNEFWKKLFYALLEEEFLSKIKKSSKSFVNILKQKKIKSLSVKGVEFAEDNELNYKEEFLQIIKSVDSDKKLIIMIDEFAQTIDNIKKNETEQSAIKVLKDHREIRQDIKFTDKLSFIYAGSIGLEGVVAGMNATKHIDDLQSIKVPPLEHQEASEFCQKLCEPQIIQIDAEHINYLLQKIEWLIPFYIQLLVQEINKLCRKQPVVDNLLIDNALIQALDHKHHFEIWFEKIKTIFTKEPYLYAKAILNIMAQENSIEKLAMANLATKHGLDEEQAKAVHDTLAYDGYINNNDDARVYRFNSPILKMWWNKNVAV